MHDIPITHHVILALGPHLAGGFDGRLGFVLLEIVQGVDFGTDEGTFKIAVNDAGGLWACRLSNDAPQHRQPLPPVCDPALGKRHLALACGIRSILRFIIAALSKPLYQFRDGLVVSAGQPGRLNVFQRLVRQWDGLHPYNAAQALKITGQADREAVSAAWHEALASLGLGRVRVSGGEYRFEYLNGDASEHSPRWVDPALGVQAWLEQEMNRPFHADGDMPFRPFVIQHGDYHWMGVAYQHWVADSYSIRLLLGQWFALLYDPAAVRPEPAQIGGGGYGKLFGPQRGQWRLTEAVLASLRWSAKTSRLRRIDPGAKAENLDSGLKILQLPRGLIERIAASAHDRGVTVNDVFLAAIAQACARYGPMRRTRRRRDLAVGSIVDLRRDSCEDLSGVFDLLLGFTGVICRLAQLRDFDRLLTAVAAQTRQQKANGHAQASVLRMLVALGVGRRLSASRLLTFYRKRCSFAGATSNLNLNGSWAGRYAGQPLLDYLRVAPTGPVTPIVLATTTLGEGMNIAMTYRRALLTPEMVDGIADSIVKRLKEFAGEDAAVGAQ